MANIVRSTTVGVSCNRQTLYNLIEDSQLSGITVSDLGATAARLIVRVGSECPADIAQGQLWWDQTDQLMRVYDTDASYAFAVGPDRFEVPAIALSPIGRGFACKIRARDVQNSTYSAGLSLDAHPYYVEPCGPGSLDYLNCVGIASETADSLGVFPLCIDGIVPAYFGGAGFGNAQSSGVFAIGASGATGALDWGDFGDASCTMHAHLGLTLDKQYIVASSNSSMCHHIKFWGPRRFPKISF